METLNCYVSREKVHLESKLAKTKWYFPREQYKTQLKMKKKNNRRSEIPFCFHIHNKKMKKKWTVWMVWMNLGKLVNNTIANKITQIITRKCTIEHGNKRYFYPWSKNGMPEAKKE